jgi:uncharacterized protein (DUF58 family)
MSAGVVPSLAELIALRASVQGRRVPGRVRQGDSGRAASPLRGRGMEYAESREYALGDDSRHIDWRLTARSGKTHTKLFQAERERLTLLVADTAPALYVGTRVRFKSVQAARTGAVAAWMAVRDGDRIGAIRGSSAEAPVSPAAGIRGALRVLDALVRWYASGPADDVGLALALDHARRLLRPGSRLVVLADPASIRQVPERTWPALAMHHEVVVLLMTDPLECDPPRAALPFVTSGGDQALPERVELDLGNPAQRARWRDTFVAPLERAQRDLKARGVRVQALSTDEPSDAWLPLLGLPRAA